MKTRVHKYVEKTRKQGYNFYCCNLIDRLRFAYCNSGAYNKWKSNGHPDELHFNTWIVNLTPQDLECEFNSHEILELLIEE